MTSPSKLRSPAEARKAYGRALVVRAATHPAALIVLVVLLVAGFVLALAPPLTIALAAGVYVVAGGVLLGNPAFRDGVLADLRPPRPDAAAIAPARPLAMPVAQAYGEARDHALKLRDLAAPDRLDQPEVAAEADRLVVHLTHGAEKASVLADTLADLDVDGIGQRLRAAETAGDADLADAYRQQLRGARRCEEQLGRYYAECRRATVEVDTIRMNLAAASSMQRGEDRRQAAEALRAVREHAGALVEGMEEAYADRPAP